VKIKIICAPGDHRDDFRQVEDQTNEWLAETKPKVLAMHFDVTPAADQRKDLAYILTVVVQYEDA
jgi:hypothetical protein